MRPTLRPYQARAVEDARAAFSAGARAVLLVGTVREVQSRDVHPGVGTDILRAVVIGETPGPDQRAVTLRQGATDQHRPGAAQRHLARLQNLDAGGRPRGTVVFDGFCLKIAHDSPSRLRTIVAFAPNHTCAVLTAT